MEQNTPKFHLRLNLFDGIVLLLALAGGPGGCSSPPLSWAG